MKDRFEREIDYLRISVTDRCNFRCRYCIPEGGIPLLPREEILTYEELEQVIKSALAIGIDKFRITGGEPLVRKDIITFLARTLRIPKIKRISLTTNGFLLKQYANRLKEIGLNNINISLDTLNPERFKQITRVDGFYQVWEGIKEVLRLGFKTIKINVVLMRDINDDEVLDFVHLTNEYPFHIRFIEFMPYGVWEDKIDEVFIGVEEIMQRVKDIEGLIPTTGPEGAGPAEYYRLKGSIGTVGFITPVTRPFCHSCNRLRLSADGKIRSCLLSTETIDLKSILRRGGEGRGNVKCKMDNEKLAIEEALQRAIMLKPKQHQARREVIMSTIGG